MTASPTRFGRASCDQQEIEEISGSSIASYDLKRAEDVGVIRQAVAETARFLGMDECRTSDLALAAGEAAANAIKHAGEGIVSVCQRNDCLVVLVSDRGPGIQAMNLPEVALKKGYTTAKSLGMGYKAIICVSDRVYLATSPDGTTAAIEMNLHPVEKPIFPDLPDLWAK